MNQPAPNIIEFLKLRSGSEEWCRRGSLIDNPAALYFDAKSLKIQQNFRVLAFTVIASAEVSAQNCRGFACWAFHHDLITTPHEDTSIDVDVHAGFDRQGMFDCTLTAGEVLSLPIHSGQSVPVNLRRPVVQSTATGDEALSQPL